MTNEDVYLTESSADCGLSIVDSRGFRAKSISDSVPKEYYANRTGENKQLQYRSCINNYQILF